MPSTAHPPAPLNPICFLGWHRSRQQGLASRIRWQGQKSRRQKAKMCEQEPKGHHHHNAPICEEYQLVKASGRVNEESPCRKRKCVSTVQSRIPCRYCENWLACHSAMCPAYNLAHTAYTPTARVAASALAPFAQSVARSLWLPPVETACHDPGSASKRAMN